MKLYSILKAVISDFQSDKTRTIVHPKDVAQCCNTLACKMWQAYKPNQVIAIDFGGSMPGEMIAERLAIPITHMTIRRDIQIKHKYKNDPIPQRWIMSAYHHYLFRTTRPKVISEFATDVSGKEVVIIDDTIHTGATLDVAVSHLNKFKCKKVKIATLSYVSTRKPDFFVLERGNYCFPWSKDYSAI